MGEGNVKGQKSVNSQILIVYNSYLNYFLFLQSLTSVCVCPVPHHLSCF